MNSNHVINGWIAQLSRDAHRGTGHSLVAVEPATPILDEGPAAETIVPNKPRGRLLPARAWGRDGSARRTVGGPCLSLG
jgi:hypothetical protein